MALRRGRRWQRAALVLVGAATLTLHGSAAAVPPLWEWGPALSPALGAPAPFDQPTYTPPIVVTPTPTLSPTPTPTPTPTPSKTPSAASTTSKPPTATPTATKTATSTPTTTATPTTSGPPPTGHVYVALGDSYAAGEGLGPYVPGTQVDEGVFRNTCHRSADAYASQVNDEGFLVRPQVLPVDREFWACSGATTSTLGIAPGTLAPADGDFQYLQPRQVPDTVHAGTRWVTLSVGAADIALDKVIAACLLGLSAEPEALTVVKVPGTPACATQLAASRAIMTSVGGDEYGELGARLFETYQALLDAAPQARLAVVGYPRVFPDDFSAGLPLAGLAVEQRAEVGVRATAEVLCRTNALVDGYWLGVDDTSARAVNALIQRVNAAALQQVARLAALPAFAGRITFANTWDDSVPHDCTGETADASVTGVVTAATGSAPFGELSDATLHPTVVGQTRIGQAVEAAFEGGMTALANEITVAGTIGRPLPAVPILIAGGQGAVVLSTGPDPLPEWLTVTTRPGELWFAGIGMVVGTVEVPVHLQDAHGHQLTITVTVEVNPALPQAPGRGYLT
jgi:hypothetical protein